MIERENFPLEDDELQGQDDQDTNDTNSSDLEEQEQLNDENLVQRIEEEDLKPEDDSDIDANIQEPSEGEEDLEELTDREPEVATQPVFDQDQPTTRNQLGDNPPGSEQAAFEAGSRGDMSNEQVKYQDKNIAENFRENIDKTSKEIDLDKRLKDDQ